MVMRCVTLDIPLGDGLFSAVLDGCSEFQAIITKQTLELNNDYETSTKSHLGIYPH